MRIDRLIVKNFKGFKHREFQFHPQFNLIAGVNGTGKTSLLDALSIAVGSWFLGFSGCDTRHIRQSEVTLSHFGEKGWESQHPCTVEATGEVVAETLSWSRSLKTPGGRTTYGEARNIKDIATQIHDSVRSGGDDSLPLISYYGTGRLWNVPREQAQVKNEQKIARKEKMSRLEGYRNSVDPRLSVAELVHWIARQSWITFQKGGQTKPLFDTVQKAIISCIDGATYLGFDADIGEIIAEIAGQDKQPFNNLSDGQRCMLAMVGDIAEKAATLNPHLGSKVLEGTPGIVFIDELDLHLHPKWQRRVIEDLRRTFPKIQFFATTHSPFLIQSLRSGEELVLLEGQLDVILLPDRDNTFAAFVYSADGKVAPAPGLSAGLRKMADDTLGLTGLDKKISVVHDENGKQVAIDRVSQRMEVWAIAEEVRNAVLGNPGNISVRRLAVKLALAEGFFSIWMTIFEADVDMRNRLIDAFNGTRNSGCFDPGTSDPVPPPNPDGLPYGGKL